ncbi:MAG: hypothetical protein GC153_01850 [Alphaproteobacteria bacterium]|nr:hypothetical protein [Alphaproteobacteria bacterium]
MFRPLVFFALAFLSVRAFAAESPFHPGPVIPEFGKVASVETDMPIPAGTDFKVQFDVTDAAKPGEINRSFDTAARFINMHVENGVPLDHIHLALVVHGPATNDLLAKSKDGSANANAPLVAALIKNGVDIYLCGQAAAAHGVAKKDLLPGVKLALSAMTAHALLSQQGYSLNPF